MKVTIINGPNLNLLGKREPSIYGTKSFDQYFEELKEKYQDIDLEYFQSNSEGDLIDKIQEVGFKDQGIVLNPGGYTHSSIALMDCISAVPVTVIEVHISNVYSREKFRQHSYISKSARGVISGLGLNGYDLAIQYLINQQ